MPFKFILKTTSTLNKVPTLTDLNKGELAVSHKVSENEENGLPTLINSLSGIYIKVGKNAADDPTDKVVRIGNVYVTDIDSVPDTLKSNEVDLDYTGALWYVTTTKRLYINTTGGPLDWLEITAYATESEKGLVKLATNTDLDLYTNGTSVVTVDKLKNWSCSYLIDKTVYQARLSMSSTEAVQKINSVSSDSFYIHPYKGNTVSLCVEGVWTGIKLLNTKQFFLTLNGLQSGITTTAFWVYDIFLYFDGTLEQSRQSPDLYQDLIKVQLVPWQTQPVYWASELEDSVSRNDNLDGNYGDPTCVVGGEPGDIRELKDFIPVRKNNNRSRLIGSVQITSPSSSSFTLKKTNLLGVDYPPKFLLSNFYNKVAHHFLVPTHKQLYTNSTPNVWRSSANSPLNRVQVLNCGGSSALTLNYASVFSLAPLATQGNVTVAFTKDKVGGSTSSIIEDMVLTPTAYLSEVSPQCSLQSSLSLKLDVGSTFVIPVEYTTSSFSCVNNGVSVSSWDWNTSLPNRYGMVGSFEC